MSLLKRIQGIFFEPRPTFEGLAAKPVWIDTLVVILLALIAFNLVVAPYMQRDQLALMKDNAALKERLGEDSYRQDDRTDGESVADQPDHADLRHHAPLHHRRDPAPEPVPAHPGPLPLDPGDLRPGRCPPSSTPVSSTSSSGTPSAWSSPSPGALSCRPRPAWPWPSRTWRSRRRSTSCWPRSTSSSSGCSASWPSASRRS